MTLVLSKKCKEFFHRVDHKYKVSLFFAYNRFFKDVNLSSIPNPKFKFVSLVYTIWKKCYLLFDEK